MKKKYIKVDPSAKEVPVLWQAQEKAQFHMYADLPPEREVISEIQTLNPGCKHKRSHHCVKARLSWKEIYK